MYYLLTRYYDPKTGRFISPDDTAYLAPKNVNGCNLYCYCNNDPVNFVDPSGHKIESCYLDLYLFCALISTILGLGFVFADKFPQTDNPINTIDTDISFEFSPLWESEWDSNLSEGKIIDGQLCFLKGYMHLDTNQSHSIYISFLNISAFLGAFFNENGFNLGGELAVSLIDIGYEGRYIDIAVPLFGTGAIAAFQNGTLEFGIDPLSTIGLNIAIHFDRIFTDIWAAI